MKIRYDIDNFLVNGYFDDAKCDYSNNQDYQEMIKNDNFTEILNKNFIKFEFAKIVIDKKKKIYTQITQKENNLLQQELIPIEHKIENKKNELTSKRKSILNQNKDMFIKMFRDFLLTISTSENPAIEIIAIANQNKDFCENDLKLEIEVEEIKNATSLEELAKFS